MTSSEPSGEARERSTLAVVDGALDRGRAIEAEPERRRLEDLALALRAETPTPRPAFVEELDRRAVAGFPPRRGALRLLEPASPTMESGGDGPAPVTARSRRSRVLGPALAAAASIVLVAVVAVPWLEREGSPGMAPVESVAPSRFPERPKGGDGLRSGSTDELREEAGPGSSTGRPRPLLDSDRGTGSVSPPEGGSFAPGRRERSVERSASLSLAAPGERLEAVADAIVRAVDRRRGLVLSSSVSSGEEEAPGGSFDLRVPAAALPELMRELSALGEVRARSQDAEDVTASRASAEEGLEEARAERRGLLRRLGRGGSAAEIASVRARLRIAGARIRGATAELRRLRTQTDYATVTVSLVSEDSSSGAPSALESAYEGFLGALVAALALGLRLLGVLVPLAAVAVPATLAARAIRRRRRESVLD